MGNTVVGKLRVSAAIVGCGAAITLGGLAAHLGESTQIHAATVQDGQEVAITTVTTPAITKAVPSITGPAPLYAGEAPDSNPQAQMP